MNEQDAKYPLDEKIKVAINIPEEYSCVKNSNGFTKEIVLTRLEIMRATIFDRLCIVPHTPFSPGVREYFRDDNNGGEWWLDVRCIPYEAFVEHRRELNLVRRTMHGIGIEEPESLVDKTVAVLSLARTMSSGSNRFLEDTDESWDQISGLWEKEEHGVIGPFGSENGVEQYNASDLHRDEARGILHREAVFEPQCLSCESVKLVMLSSDANVPDYIAIDRPSFHFRPDAGEISPLESMFKRADFVGFDLHSFSDIFRVAKKDINIDLVCKYINDSHQQKGENLLEILESTIALYLRVVRKGVSFGY